MPEGQSYSPLCGLRLWSPGAGAAAKKLTSPKTKTIKLTWAKSAKTYTVKKASAASKTVTGLKKGSKYFARVRAYKKIGKTDHFGAWSSVKSVKSKSKPPLKWWFAQPLKGANTG